MVLRAIFVVALLAGLSSVGHAGTPLLHESFAVFSRPGTEVRGAPEAPMLPSRTGAGFGASGRATATVSGTGAASTFGALRRRSSLCGPSAAVNTIGCYGFEHGNWLGDFPIPGSLSTTPVFFEESWIFGTTEGFLVRTNRLIGGQAMPLVENSRLLALWGAESRKEMAKLRQNNLPAEYKWVFSTSAEFTGTPIIVNNVVLALASNQFLYALDWGTGRVLWTLRLAPDTPIRLTGDSLALIPGRKEGEVAVGTSEGLYLGVSVATGQVQWRHRMPTVPGERFHAAVAEAKPIERSLLLASAEGMVQRVTVDRCPSSEGSDSSTRCSGDARFVDWSFPVGTTFAPLIIGSRVVVGGEDGSLIMLDGARSGALVWRVPLFGVPVVALAAIPAQAPEYILASSSLGSLFLIDFKGKIRGALPAVGVPVGDFIPGRSADEVCLAYAVPGMRCFSIAY